MNGTLLKPLRDYPSYSINLAKEIYAQLYKNIFQPLEGILAGSKEIHNAKTTSLEEAIRTGRIRFVNGFFLGNLNSALSKELRGIGARFNKVRKSYYSELSVLPQNIVQAISAGNLKAKNQIEKVEDFLHAIEGRKIQMGDMSPFLEDTLKKLDTQFHQSTKVITSRDLEIPIETHLVGQIRDAYTYNLDWYIQKFHDDEVLRLRKKVERNVSQGFRAERLIDTIMAEKRMTKNHARFIARQETSNMTSIYTQLRYQDIGINEFIWSTSMDSKVRPTATTRGIARLNDHRILQGRKFRFDKPPIVDSATAKTALPGQDYGCRCHMIPFVSEGINFLKPKPSLERLTAY